MKFLKYVSYSIEYLCSEFQEFEHFGLQNAKKYMAGKFTRAAHLWREITQIEFRVKRWHKKYEY